MHLLGGSLGEGCPLTLHTSEVPRVKDILRRYQGKDAAIPQQESLLRASSPSILTYENSSWRSNSSKP